MMKYLIFVFFSIAVLIGYGFTRSGLNTNPAKKTEPGVLSFTGEMLYQKNCAICHGIDRQGNPPAFPSLIELEKRMDKSTVVELLDRGRIAMPTFSHLTESEQKAITGYLYGESITSDVVTEIGQLETGEYLFVANCASCHKVTKEDPVPSGQRDWGKQPAVLGNVIGKFNQNTFNHVLNIGPCYMPSFDLLGEEKKEAIYAYLKSFESNLNKEEVLDWVECSKTFRSKENCCR